MFAQLLTRFRDPLREISASELDNALRAEQSPILIDIRSADQFATGHLPGAVHIPLNRLAAEAGRLSRSAPTVVY
jgi:rhodanese-related sulfurtransferase